MNTALVIPDLIDKAAVTLAGAKTAGEVLHARESATLAYDAAKRAARLSAAKQAAHDVIDAMHQLQGDALVIEAQCKARLADEYDAAQDRGEVQRHGKVEVPKGNLKPATLSQIGISKKEVHEARKVRDVLAKKPDAMRVAVDSIIASGHEPTRAAVNRAIDPRPAAKAKPKAKSPVVSISSSNVISPISRCAMGVRNAVLKIMDEVPPAEWDALIAELRGELDDLEQVMTKRRAA